MQRIFVIVLMTCLVSGPLCAQEIGQRVRISTDYKTVIGTVVERNRTELTLALNHGGSTKIRLGDIKGMERSGGKTNKRFSHSVMGGLLGGAIGAVRERNAKKQCEEDFEDVGFGSDDARDSCEFWSSGVIADWITFGGGGAVLGFAVGYFLEKEKWTKMPFETSMFNRPFLIHPQADLVYNELGTRLSLVAKITF